LAHLEKIVSAGMKSIELLPEIVENEELDEDFAFTELVKIVAA